jgi:hypothetical protein
MTVEWSLPFLKVKTGIVSMLSRSIKSLALLVLLVSQSTNLVACCGSEDPTKNLTPKEKMFKKILNDAVDQEMNVINHLGRHVKNNACKYSIAFVLASWVGLAILTAQFVGNKTLPWKIGGGLGALFTAPFVGIVVSCIATPLVRCTGNILEWKSRLYVPAMIALIKNWESVKHMVPEQFIPSFEQFMTQFKATGNFSSMDEDMIGRIFEQFVDA